MRPIHLLTLLSITALPWLAQAAPPRLLATLDLASKNTEFTRARPLRIIDGGRLLYLGKGTKAAQQTLHLVRLKDGERFTVTAPLHAYLDKHPELKLPSAGDRSLHELFRLDDLVYYDTRAQAAGLLVEDFMHRGAGVRRTFLMRWDLKDNTITQARLLDRYTRGGKRATVFMAAFNPAKEEVVIARMVGDRGGPRQVVLTGHAPGISRHVAAFDTQRQLSMTAFPDLANHRTLLVEYAEKDTAGPPPRGYLVDLAGGGVKHLAVPPTTYGALFQRARRGDLLHAYSAQLGQLWTIHLKTGKRLRRYRLGKRGHALGMLRPGTALLLRSRGLQRLRLSDRGVRRGRFTAMKKVVAGVLNISGSKVAPGRALIRTGDSLHLVAVP